MPITHNGLPVTVLDADVARREATVEWASGRVRLVSMLALRGTAGGELEVARVCREAEVRGRAREVGSAYAGTGTRTGTSTVRTGTGVAVPPTG